MLSLLNSCLSKVAPGRPHSASRYIMEDVFVFLPPRPLSCCVFLAKMVSSRPAPCWHFFCVQAVSAVGMPAPTWCPCLEPSLDFLAHFCACVCSAHCVCVHVCAVHNMCASHLPGHIGVRLTKSGLDGYSQMNASPSIGSQASNMNVQKRHWPFYTVYQMKRRFIFRSPISSICTPESSYPDAQGGHHWQKNSLPPLWLDVRIFCGFTNWYLSVKLDTFWFW